MKTYATRNGNTYKSLTKARRHDLLVFWFLFPRTPFLPWRGRCGTVEERTFRNICFDPGEFRGRIRRIVGHGWGSRIRPWTHLWGAWHWHVGPILRHCFVVQPIRKTSSLEELHKYILIYIKNSVVFFNA